MDSEPRPAWASALKSSTNRENNAVDRGASRSVIGKDQTNLFMFWRA